MNANEMKEETMTLTCELAPDVENRLHEEAVRRGLSVEETIGALLAERLRR